jgi:hypothetical protein
MGRAEGIAIATGSTIVAAEHLLVSILWESITTYVLQRLGAIRDEVIAHLSALVVWIRSLKLTSPVVPAFGERVFVPMDKLDYLARTIPDLLPEGTPFGLNHDRSGRAWLVAGEGIDLPSYVGPALDRESGSN